MWPIGSQLFLTQMIKFVWALSSDLHFQSKKTQKDSS